MPAGPPGSSASLKILFLVLAGLDVAAIFWMTSRRSRIAPATLATGTGAGMAFGLVMYVVTPLGLSAAATNPFLPGSDIDPLVLLAWLLLPCAPVTAAVVADRYYTASGSAPSPAGARTRQMMAAGLLTSLAGALLVTVLGMGTTAAVLKAAWLRDWLDHGPRLLYGVQNLSSDLRTLPAIAYSHELTGSVDAGVPRTGRGPARRTDPASRAKITSIGEPVAWSRRHTRHFRTSIAVDSGFAVDFRYPSTCK